jgi:hypothetical protein
MNSISNKMQKLNIWKILIAKLKVIKTGMPALRYGLANLLSGQPELI